MHEGGKRLVVAPPGPMQRQGTKSLLWVVGLSEALEEAGGGWADATGWADAHAVCLADLWIIFLICHSC